MANAILLISCPDKRGITAAVTNFIFVHNGNILHADQHIDDQTSTFFMRVEWSLEQFTVAKGEIAREFEKIAKPFNMQWQIDFSDQRPRLGIFVSKHLHCLYDLLYRYKAQQFKCEIPLIISNHPDAKGLAKDFGIDFKEFYVTAENKGQEEKKQLKLLEDYKIDFIVLARYHQVLSKSFVEKFENRIINIHHSFLPAFAGQNPYKQAYQKGVKIIGATSHYVTEKLDDGPIIEQDTVRISHRHALEDLKRLGEDLEKAVLGRAVRWHLSRKILVYNNKTVIFD